MVVECGYLDMFFCGGFVGGDKGGEVFGVMGGFVGFVLFFDIV